MSKPVATKSSHAPLQLVVSFIIPIIILSRFSNDSSLGPTYSLLLALAFPIAYELYSYKKTKKPSLLSALAIGGILVTGVVTLLGLSEGWLAIRRSIPYIAVGTALLISIFIKRPLLPAVLPSLLDMDRVNEVIVRKHLQSLFNKKLNFIGYMLTALLFLVAVVSYVLTTAIITSQTGSTLFNVEYAKLRLLSILFVTLPLVIGITAISVYLMKVIEKLTGIDVEELLKKR